MLTLRHFTIFKAVADTGSFTKAASRLYITQSAVSHTIRELEEYTHTVLFDRLSKKVQLTAGGRLLLEEVLPILSACDALDERIRSLEQSAPLRIVSSITIATARLPGILKELKKTQPRLPVYVTVVRAAEAAEILRKGDADIAFVEGAKPQGPFCFIHFSGYGLQPVCAPDHPLPSPVLSPDAFCQEPLLLREPGSAIRDALDSALFILGFTARPMWTSVNSTALLEAAKAGLGITVLPEMLVKAEIEKGTLRTIQIQGLSLKNDMLAVYHKNKHLTPGLKALLSLL